MSESKDLGKLLRESIDWRKYKQENVAISEELIVFHDQSISSLESSLKIVWQRFKEIESRLTLLEPKPKTLDQPSFKIKIKKSELT